METYSLDYGLHRRLCCRKSNHRRNARWARTGNGVVQAATLPCPMLRRASRSRSRDGQMSAVVLVHPDDPGMAHPRATGRVRRRSVAPAGLIAQESLLGGRGRQDALGLADLSQLALRSSSGTVPSQHRRRLERAVERRRQVTGDDPAGRDRMSADGVTAFVTTASQNQPTSAERQDLIIEEAFCGCSVCSGDGCFSALCSG